MNGTGPRPLRRSHFSVQPEVSDRDLMDRFAGRGDESAFDALVRRWDRRILAYLAKSAGDLEAAEDMRQDVFIRVYRYGASYDPAYAFSTWVFRIARNVLNDWLTKNGRRRETAAAEGVVEELPDPGDGAREQLSREERREAVRGLIAELDAEERELLYLKFEMEMSYAEIGRVIDAPATTVKSRAYKLLGVLRRRLLASRAVETR